MKPFNLLLLVSDLLIIMNGHFLFYFTQRLSYGKNDIVEAEEHPQTDDGN